MASKNPNTKQSLYPEVIQSNPESPSSFFPNPNTQSSSNLYPSIDMHDLVENIFPDHLPSHDNSPHAPPSAAPEAFEEVLISIPGAVVNLIDRNYSVELARGDLNIVRLRHGQNVVAVLARVADEIQWPLALDEAAVKLDDSHYFFSLRVPEEHHYSDSSDDDDGHKDSKKHNDESKKCDDLSENMLNYGLTIGSKGQEVLMKEFDGILETYSCFSVQKVSENAQVKGEALLGKSEISASDVKSGKMEGKCAAYWTTLAPNVEDYSTTSAQLIAAGSGQLIKGILWCGDVTMDRLKWGNEVMKRRMSPKSKSEISPETLKRIKRVKRVTKMTAKVANGILSGVVKVSGFFTSSVANSKVGKKFFSMLPGEIVLASLDGFNKVCDAIEVAGRNVMSTSSTVTTELVNQRYGEQAAEATNQGLGAAGHAIGTAWTLFKIRKAINPKSVLKPTALAKSAAKAAAAEMKAKKSK